MKCSLIISVYNDIETLILILEALKVQTEKQFEVIIADDGSNENFVKKLNEIKPFFLYKIIIIVVIAYGKLVPIIKTCALKSSI